jgi:hypothetical protein
MLDCKPKFFRLIDKITLHSNIMKITNITAMLAFSALSASQAGAVSFTVDFDDLIGSNDSNTCYIGSADGDNTYVSGGVTFTVNYNATYGSWSGIAYSGVGLKYVTSSSYSDQYYKAIDTADFETPSVIDFYGVVYDPGAYGDSPAVTLPDGMSSPISMSVDNNAYAYGSILYGDSFAEAFTTGDWFMLTATGYDAEAAVTGSASFYLADYRSDTESDHYIISASSSDTTIDLTPLGDNVKTIKFTLSSSDTTAYGLNTPAYFIINNLVIDGTTYLWANPNEWDYTTWYGSVYAFQNEAGWIFSADNHSYQYAAGASDGGVWIYDFDLGWYWTSDEVYPYVFLYDAIGQWAYFYQGSGTDSESRVFCIWDETLNDKVEEYPYATVRELKSAKDQ